MKFDEQGFRHLAGETTATIIRLGTTSHAVLDRYKRFTEMLVEYLKSLAQPFELTRCLEWVNSLEHDPASVLSASYVDWKALHRFVHLLAEQQAAPNKQTEQQSPLSVSWALSPVPMLSSPISAFYG